MTGQTRPERANWHTEAHPDHHHVATPSSPDGTAIAAARLVGPACHLLDLVPAAGKRRQDGHLGEEGGDNPGGEERGGFDWAGRERGARIDAGAEPEGYLVAEPAGESKGHDRPAFRADRLRSPGMAGFSGPRHVGERSGANGRVQPQSKAAIELIHKQPVRWTHDRVVACDGGGGPMGHPRVFINVDKPEITPCGYCGLPFVCSSCQRPSRAWGGFLIPIKLTGPLI